MLGTQNDHQGKEGQETQVEDDDEEHMEGRSKQLRTQTLGQPSQLKVHWLLPRVLASKAQHTHKPGKFCSRVAVFACDWKEDREAIKPKGTGLKSPRKRTRLAS